MLAKIIATEMIFIFEMILKLIFFTETIFTDFDYFENNVYFLLLFILERKLIFAYCLRSHIKKNALSIIFRFLILTFFRYIFLKITCINAFTFFMKMLSNNLKIEFISIIRMNSYFIKVLIYSS